MQWSAHVSKYEKMGQDMSTCLAAFTWRYPHNHTHTHTHHYLQTISVSLSSKLCLTSQHDLWILWTPGTFRVLFSWRAVLQVYELT